MHVVFPSLASIDASIGDPSSMLHAPTTSLNNFLPRFLLAANLHRSTDIWALATTV